VSTGTINPLSFFDYAGKTTNIDQWGASTLDWDSDIPYTATSVVEGLVGPLTDNLPIDFIHWGISGSMAVDPVTLYWGRCMITLLHI
jgi:hypothetical protein